jgi:serine/threonine-protein kinase HipA
MEASGGLRVPTHGVGGSWIVKLPSTQHVAVPENEYAMLELARIAGIQIPPVRLTRVADIEGRHPMQPALKATLLRSSDLIRASGGRRIHMEDFAPVFGLFADDKYGEPSYASIAAVLWAETGVLIGNADMHLQTGLYFIPMGERRSCRRHMISFPRCPIFQATRWRCHLEGQRISTELRSIGYDVSPTLLIFR